jgi:ribosomal protein S3
MLNFFHQIFPQLKVRGLKLKLKGKISSAGNSRKKLILYRIGETSHSSLNLKVLNEVGTVVTFTGVMGLSVSIFF